MSELKTLLSLVDIRHSFTQGMQNLVVLEQINFNLHKGEVVALVGPSGVGKSTLLHIAGLLEQPTAGTILIDGVDSAELSEAKQSRLRLNKLGFVYQYHYLLPEFSALENILIPLMVKDVYGSKAQEWALQLLSHVGLEHRHHHRPGAMSGGEQQRLALARALANGPMIILADEPTGNLDHKTSDTVMEFLFDYVHSNGASALVATHDEVLANAADRIIHLNDGHLVEKG